MELRRLYPSNSSAKKASTPVQLRVNGNKRTSTQPTTILTPSNIGSDHCGSIPPVTNNLRSRAFYAKLPPLGRSTLTTVSTVNDNQSQNESSELKLNVLFDLYKVTTMLYIIIFI